MSREETPTLELRNVYRSFKQGSQTLEVLRGINLNIEKAKSWRLSALPVLENRRCCKLPDCLKSRQRARFI